jgi:hypothetical protein
LRQRCLRLLSGVQSRSWSPDEQLGFRKVVVTSFMMGFMFPNDVNEGDTEKDMNRMRRTQMDLDIEPEKCKHLLSE